MYIDIFKNIFLSIGYTKNNVSIENSKPVAVRSLYISFYYSVNIMWESNAVFKTTPYIIFIQKYPPLG